MPNAAVPDRVHILLRARLDVRIRRHLLDRHRIWILVACSRRALVLRGRFIRLRSLRHRRLLPRLRGSLRRWRSLLWLRRRSLRRSSLLTGLRLLPALRWRGRRLLARLRGGLRRWRSLLWLWRWSLRLLARRWRGRLLNWSGDRCGTQQRGSYN